MTQPDISVTICTYNRSEMLRRALESVVCQETNGKFTYEILVVDNASTDDTREVVQDVARRSQVPVRYIREESLGMAYTRNTGVKESRGEWLAVFDDDQVAEADWLRELLEVALDKGCHCVGGRMLLCLPGGDLSRLSAGLRWALGETDWGEQPIKCSGKKYPSDANVIRRREVFEIVGEFDTSMVFGGQDQDFSRRVAMAGLESWYSPKAIAYHFIPAYRLTPEYTRWNSLRAGAGIAYVDSKLWGRAKMTLACVARLGQALLVNVPLLFWAYLTDSDVEVLWRKNLLWRVVGYTRGALFLLAPGPFSQRRFFAGLDFRKVRRSFGKS